MKAIQRINIKLTVLAVFSVLFLLLVSCNNPVNRSLAAIDQTADEPAPETGIITDSATGLIAGIPLDGDTLLSYPGVSASLDAEGVPSIEWVEGLSGSALKNDEDGDYIRIADGTLPELTVSGTVEVWVKPEGNTYYAGILHKGENPDVAPGWYFVDETWTMLFHDDLKPYFFAVCENGAGDITTIGLKADNEIELNQWSHLAASWNYDEISGETSIKLFVNGVEVPVTIEADYNIVDVIPNNVGPVRDTDGDLIIGSQLPEEYNSNYGHFTFIGLIDEVSLYNVERSAEEIRADYEVYSSIL